MMLTADPSLTLNQHGDACRCLLRLREDQGRPVISDRHFIEEHLERYPAWREHPGAADIGTIHELAKELGLAHHIDLSRDYARVLDDHRNGISLLICTERPPQQQTGSPLPYDRYVTVLQRMDKASFTLWCPYRSGHAEVLPPARASWWDEWLCVAIALRPAP